MKVRTRFAPSPTGKLHIGAIRTALFSWLLARHRGGEFFLRIEDTDRERFVPGAIRQIVESMQWVGFDFDGAPDHAELSNYVEGNEDFPSALDDGEYKGIKGPFMQSARLAQYRAHTDWLIEQGFAYRCNETAEELDAMRNAAIVAGRTFMFREANRLRTDVRADEKHVVRLRLPTDGQAIVQDLVMGTLTFEYANIGDPVIMKSDGYPTYHLAAMYDDHAMGVTHIVRSTEWIPSLPIHVHLFQVSGWAMPHFAHVPNVNGDDGKKLSKRRGAPDMLEFRDKGYLPEAVMNFMALLGWAPGGGDEQNVFTKDELIAKFDLDHVGSSPAIFSYPKLDWLNGMHIRRLTQADLANRLVPYLAKDGIVIDSDAKLALLQRLTPLIQERIKKLTEATAFIDFCFNDIPAPPREMLIGQKLDAPTSHRALQMSRDALAAVAHFDDETEIERVLNGVCEQLQLKRNQVFGIVRNAISGKTVTPPLFGTLAALGRETVLTRIDRALQVLA